MAVVSDVAVSFDNMGSPVTETTVAVLESVPVVWAVATMVTVALEPLFRMPRLHDTVVVPLQEPWVAEEEKNATPAWRVSVTETPVAASGPWLGTG